MRTTYAKELAEARLGKPVGDWLAFYHELGLSAAKIARRLQVETGVEVSSRTILRWIDETEAAA